MSNSSRLLKSRMDTETSQEMELVDMGRIDEEDRQFLIIDKDTGDVYDMRNQEHVEFLTEQTTCYLGASKNSNWQQWWKQKKNSNEEYLQAAELGNLS